jgi:hypothetical protein
VDIHEDTRLESPRDDDGDDEEEDDWEDLDDDSTPPSQQRPPEATVWNPINKSSAAAARARKAARDLQAALAMSFEQLSSPARAPPSAVPAPTTSTRARRPQPRRTLSSSSGHSGIFADPVSAAEEDDGSATEEETDVERLESTGRLSSGNNTLSNPAAVVPTVEHAETFQTGSQTPVVTAAGTEAIGRDDPRFEALIVYCQKLMKEADDVRRRRARQGSSTTTTAAAAATTTTTRKIKETPVPLPHIPPPRRSVAPSVLSTPPSATRTGKRKQPTPQQQQQQQQQQAQSTNNNSYSSPVPQTPPSPTEKAKGKRRRLSPETPPQVPEKMMTVEEWRAEQEAEESRAMEEAIRRSLLVKNARKGYHGQEKNGSPSSRAAAYAPGTTSNVQMQAVEEEEMDAVSRQLIEEQQAMYDKLEEGARRNQNKKTTDKPTPKSAAGTKTQSGPEMAISFTFEERPSDVREVDSTTGRGARRTPLRGGLR